MTQRKRPKKVSRPSAWTGTLKKRAADKAREKAEPAPEVDPRNITHVPELCAPAPAAFEDDELERDTADCMAEKVSSGTDPNLVGFDKVQEFAGTSDQPGRLQKTHQEESAPEQDFPPAETDIHDTKTAIPAGPSKQEREYVAALETRVIEDLDDTDDTVIVGTKTEQLKDVEAPDSEEQLESVLDSTSEASDCNVQPYEGVSVTEKYSVILQLASGEKIVIDEKNRCFWEKALEEVDTAYATAPDAEKQEAEEFRNYVFEAYAGAKGCKSKDKEVLVYVLSELAETSAGRGECEKAFNYARRARQVSKTELIKNPCAESLHKWGMLEHNVEFYENQLKENTVTAEAE
ncbi:hypothetical protein GF343_03435 [Candidatus Woesearchaeota archaeon]|nr:hypothetical protein [Candidatus Woesearchaeota archaeon]